MAPICIFQVTSLISAPIPHLHQHQEYQSEEMQEQERESDPLEAEGIYNRSCHSTQCWDNSNNPIEPQAAHRAQ